MDQKSRPLLSLSLGPGRSQLNFLNSFFLETLTQCTNLTCMAVSQSDSFVNQQQKWTQTLETSSCPTCSAHCQKENTLTSNRSWVYKSGRGIFFFHAGSAFDMCWGETSVSLFFPSFLVCPSPECPFFVSLEILAPPPPGKQSWFQGGKVTFVLLVWLTCQNLTLTCWYVKGLLFSKETLGWVRMTEYGIPEFLNLGIIETWGWITLVGGCPVYQRLFISIPDLPDASSTPSPLL